MGKKRTLGKEVCICPRLRVMVGNEIALGPGRVELLELIEKTGSLRAAALRMGVSYMRAWNLVRYTNKCFCQPLVEATRGGRVGGGARLTDAGRKIVAEYRQMERKSRRAIGQTWAKLKQSLKA